MERSVARDRRRGAVLLPLLRDDRAARRAPDDRHRPRRVALAARQALQRRLSQPGGGRRPLLAFRRRGLGFPLPDVLPAGALQRMSPYSGSTEKEKNKAYVLAWLGLMICLALTFGSSYIPLGPWNTVINTAI